MNRQLVQACVVLLCVGCHYEARFSEKVVNTEDECECLAPLALGQDDGRRLTEHLLHHETALLCPDSTYTLESAIKITKSQRKISTQGSPEDGSRALLVAVDNSVTGVIRTDSSSAPLENLEISYLQIDGGRFNWPIDESHSENLGPVRCSGFNDCAPLITLSQVSDASVHHVKMYNPRGWSHVWAGTLDECYRVSIEYNEIGPGGDPIISCSDGISLQCYDSVVSHNEIIDVSDGGIVIFGSRGSTISHNVIRAINENAFIGIAMTDYEDRDFSDLLVEFNEIATDQAYIHIGIAAGKRLWFGSDDDSLGWATVEAENVIVSDNMIAGENYGIALAISGVNGFSFINNRIQGEVLPLVDRDYSLNSSLPESRINVWPRSLDWAIYKELYIFHLYREILQRYPSSVEVETLLEEYIGLHGCSDRTLHGIVLMLENSEESRSLWEIDQTGHIDAIYHALIHRSPNLSELESSIETLRNGGNLGNLIRTLIYSDEGRIRVRNACRIEARAAAHEDIVESAYRLVLERRGDVDGRNFFVNQLDNSSTSPRAILVDMVFSDEYERLNSHKTNREYVDDLYRRFLRREADQNGRDFFLERIESGEVRRWEIAASFFYAEEFENHPLNAIYFRE